MRPYHQREGSSTRSWYQNAVLPSNLMTVSLPALRAVPLRLPVQVPLLLLVEARSELQCWLLPLQPPWLKQLQLLTSLTLKPLPPPVTAQQLTPYAQLSHLVTVLIQQQLPLTVYLTACATPSELKS